MKTPIVGRHIPSAPSFKHSLLVLAMCFGALALTGCANFKSEPLSAGEVRTTVQTDQATLARDVVPLSGPLQLDEAIARAIKYNAERRLRAMEEAVAYGTFEAGQFDMLPKLMATAGYRYRDKELVTRSTDSVTGAPSLANPYISSDREAVTTSLGFSWSLLDFGQSYFAARQNADRVQIAAERRRKAINTLVQDVRTAYWRVVAAQHLDGALRTTIADAEGALDDARKAENEQLRSPLEPLRYQRQVLESVRTLEAIQQELSTARIELASLIGLLPGSSAQLTVVEPQVTVNQAWLQVPVEQLEARALALNPDLRESHYNTRIAQQETRRVLLRLFPGLSFNYALNHSTDSYLINDSWKEAGVQVSYNLLGLVALPSQMRLADAGVALADQKRMATQVAVLTQLHIARLQYANAAHQFERADAIAQVDQRISGHVGNQVAAAKQTRLDGVAQQTASILSSLRRYQALSNAQAAASRLQATLGLEPGIQGSDKLPLPELSAAVAKSLAQWDAGKLE